MGGLVSRNRSGLRPANEVFEPEKLSLHIFEHQAERFFLIFDRLNIQSIDGNFIVGIAEADSQPSCCPLSIEMSELSNGNQMDLNLYASLARKAFSDCTYSGARHRVLVGNSPLESMSPPSSESSLMSVCNSVPLSRDGKLLAVLERFVANYRGTDFGASTPLTGSNMGLSPREAWHVTDMNDELHLRQISPHMSSVLQALLPTAGGYTRVKLVLCLVGMARVMHDLDDFESMQRRSSLDTALLQRPRAYSMESHLPLSLSQSNVNPALHHIPREISISRSGSGQGPRFLAHHNSSHTIRASPPAFQHTEAVEDAGLRHSYDGRAMKRLSQKRMLAPTTSLPSLHGAAGRGSAARISTPTVHSGLIPPTGMSPPPVKQKTPISSPRDFAGNISDEEESPSPSSTPSGSVIGIASPPFQFTPPGSNIAGRLPPGISRTAPLFTPSPPLTDQAIDLLNEQKMRRIIDAISRSLTERKQSADQVRDVEWSGE